MTTIENIFIGKVRNCAILDNGTRILQTSNRVSAFDFILPFEVENKAEILQAISVWFFNRTSHIIENNLIGCLDETHTLVKEAKVFPIEIIVRAYLTGSLWRLYENKGVEGVFSEYGILLQEGLKKNQKLDNPIITPSTKAENGHDVPISHEKAIQIVGLANWNFIESKAKELFLFGENEAKARGLILVDTKYEMGLYQNKIILVDEVHTPDSSRYWYQNDLNLSSPRQISKEFLREEIIKIIGKPEDLKENPANHPYFKNTDNVKNIAQKMTALYQTVYNTFIVNLSPKDICSKILTEWPISQDLFRTAIQSSIMPSKILVIGNGGRDYSIYSAFAKLNEVNTVYCSSGNRNWNSSKYSNCSFNTVHEIARFALQNNIGLIIAGPELPIAQNIKNECLNVGIPILAPSVNCASLEASKILCKEIINTAKVKSPNSTVISWKNLKSSLEYYIEHGFSNSKNFSLPCVLKYDGLAYGKGVFILKEIKDILDAINIIEQNIQEWENLSLQITAPTYCKNHGESFFLIEDVLSGEEISVIALCNGANFRFLPVARDYKRRNDGQNGLNTGGMGAASPITLNSKIMDQIKIIFSNTLQELIKRNMPYQGFLFAGFMIDKNETVWLLEYNCRLGDPETQVILPGLQRDFYTELFRTARGLPFLFPEKSQTYFSHDNLKRVFVVGASPEYPEKNAPKRKVIISPDDDKKHESCELIPSAIDYDNTTTGGRIFGIISTAKTFLEAQKNVYKKINTVKLENQDGTKIKPHFRTDIAAEFISKNY